MRQFQIMRYKRRTNPLTNEFIQSVLQSDNLTAALPSHPSSLSLSDTENLQNSIQSDENETPLTQRRHLIGTPNILTSVDSVDLSRRASVCSGRRFSFQQQELSEASKSKANINNFYIFFILLFLFIFLAVIYSFIRMIRNQS